MTKMNNALITLVEALGFTAEGTCIRHPDIQICDGASSSIIKPCPLCCNNMPEQQEVEKLEQQGEQPEQKEVQLSAADQEAAFERAKGKNLLFNSLLSRWCEVQESPAGNDRNMPPDNMSTTTAITTTMLFRQMFHLEQRVQQQQSTIEGLHNTVQRQQKCIQTDLKIIMKTLGKMSKDAHLLSGVDDLTETSRANDDQETKENTLNSSKSNNVIENDRRNELRMTMLHPSSLFTSVRTIDLEPSQPVQYQFSTDEANQEHAENATELQGGDAALATHFENSFQLSTAADLDSVKQIKQKRQSELVKKGQHKRKNKQGACEDIQWQGSEHSKTSQQKQEIEFTAPVDDGKFDVYRSVNSLEPHSIFEGEQPSAKKSGSNSAQQQPIVPGFNKSDLAPVRPQKRNSKMSLVQGSGAMQIPVRPQFRRRFHPKKMSSSTHNSTSIASKSLRSMKSVKEDDVASYSDDQQAFNNNLHNSNDNSSMPMLAPAAAPSTGKPSTNKQTSHKTLESEGSDSAFMPFRRDILTKTKTQEISSLTLDPEIEALEYEDKAPVRVTNKRLKDRYGEEGTYTGTIDKEENVPEGFGKMEYDNVRFYEGEWKIGRWHGHGFLVNPNGDTYEGEFVYDARHGQGVYEFKNGDVYEGAFSQDKRHGKGTFMFKNGNVYKGEHVQGNFEGYGRYDFKGGYYEGEWEEGLYEGIGTLQYKDGGSYSGRFVNGIAHGFGEETFPDGTKRKGIWKSGKFQRPKTPPIQS